MQQVSEVTKSELNQMAMDIKDLSQMDIIDMLRDIKQKIMLKDNSIRNSLIELIEENSDANETIANLKSKLSLKVRDHSNIT